MFEDVTDRPPARYHDADGPRRICTAQARWSPDPSSPDPLRATGGLLLKLGRSRRVGCWTMSLPLMACMEPAKAIMVATG